MMEGADDGCTCPLNCCKRGGGGVTERHGWVSVGGIRKCQCPVCQCPCNKLMYAKDWQRIGLAQLQKARLGPNEPSGQEQLSQFLGQTMHAAQQALRDVRHIGEKQGWELQSQQFQGNVFNAAAAEHVVRQTGNLGSNAIQHALESFAIIQKINISHIHNYKDPKALTRTDKAQRKAAKNRKTQMLELRKEGHDEIEDSMRDMIGPGDITLRFSDIIIHEELF